MENILDKNSYLALQNVFSVHRLYKISSCRSPHKKHWKITSLVLRKQEGYIESVFFPENLSLVHQRMTNTLTLKTNSILYKAR
jgi:hypothetical protein